MSGCVRLVAWRDGWPVGGGWQPPIARVIRMFETESIEDENGVPFLVIYGICGNTHRFWSPTNASRRSAGPLDGWPAPGAVVSRTILAHGACQ